MLCVGRVLDQRLLLGDFGEVVHGVDVAWPPLHLELR